MVISGNITYENIRYVTADDLKTLPFSTLDEFIKEATARKADATQVLNWLKIIKYEKSNGALQDAHRKAGGKNDSL